MTSYNFIEISNYLATVRQNVNFNPKGPQSIEFERDDTGVPIAFNNTQMNMHSDTSADIQWNPSLAGNFWLEEIIDGVVYQHDYDGVNLTTYTDNVAGTPIAHTPENASYIVGKGVYPKVTADPYTTYVSPFFSENVVAYAEYNQAARYTILAAI